MFIGQLKVSRNGRSSTHHRLLESVRTAKGPRQRSAGTVQTRASRSTSEQRESRASPERRSALLDGKPNPMMAETLAGNHIHYKYV